MTIEDLRKLSAEARRQAELALFDKARATLTDCANLLDRLTDEGVLDRMTRAYMRARYGDHAKWDELTASNIPYMRAALNALLAGDGQ